MHVGWPADRGEVDVVATERDLARRVARSQRHLGRGLGDQLRNQAAVEAHLAAGPLDLGARALQQVERGLAHELDAELLEDLERGEMDRLELILAQDLNGPVGVDERAPGQLLDTPAAAAARGFSPVRAGHDTPLPPGLSRRNEPK